MQDGFKTVSQSATREISQVGKFGIVGLANTLIDFGLFNFFTKFAHYGLIQSNIISTTTAMVFSFFANKQLVFKPGERHVASQAIAFFVVTAFGLYVIQNGIIHLLTAVWPEPLHGIVHIVRGVGIHFFSDGFYINNGAKAIATVASLTWNYIVYKRVVFR